MLVGIFIILALQLTGEALQKYFNLTIPGPVIGNEYVIFGLRHIKLKIDRNFNAPNPVQY